VLLDCGPGVLSEVQRHLPLGELDAVVVSHEHPDHCAELGVLQNAWQWGLGRVDLPVFGTAGTLVKAEAASSRGTVVPAFDWHVMTDGSQVDLGALTLTFSRTDHPVETLAVRVDHPDGTSLAYSADTGPGWSLSALGPGIDLALCEATFLDDTMPAGVAHLTCRQAAETAREAGVSRLVITHHFPGEDLDAHLAEAQRHFPRPVQLAQVGATYAVADIGGGM
jgi:ribonuclease BN (tRNA processing enzyme)